MEEGADSADSLFGQKIREAASELPDYIKDLIHEKCAELRNENNELKAQLADSKKEANQYHSEIRDLTATLERKKSEIDLSKQEAEQNALRMEQLQVTVEAAKKAKRTFEANIKKLTDHETALTLEVKQLQSLLAIHRKNARELRVLQAEVKRLNARSEFCEKNHTITPPSPTVAHVSTVIPESSNKSATPAPAAASSSSSCAALTSTSALTPSTILPVLNPPKAFSSSDARLSSSGGNRRERQVESDGSDSEQDMRVEEIAQKKRKLTELAPEIESDLIEYVMARCNLPPDATEIAIESLREAEYDPCKAILNLGGTLEQEKECSVAEATAPPPKENLLKSQT